MNPPPIREVTLVTGPPCAGKSTFVALRAGKNDGVIDHDVIARRLGSGRRWGHRRQIREQAERLTLAAMDGVVQMTSGRAWVIRCAPEGPKRVELAAWLRATRVVVLLPPAELLRWRALQRGDSYRTCRAISRWFERYTPAEVDELITDVPA